MIDTIDELSRGVVQVKKGAAFLQANGAQAAPPEQLVGIFGKLIDAAWLGASDKATLQSFLQQAKQQVVQESGGPENQDLSLAQQPQGKTSNYGSHSGGIVDTLEDMQGKAENTLSDLRKADMNNGFNFKLAEQSLQDEIKVSKEKKAAGTASKAANAESVGKANGEKAAVEKTLAADQEFLASLKMDCESKAKEWAIRQESAAEEAAVIEKAKEILTSGVKVFVQVSAKSHRSRRADSEADKDEEEDERRERLADALRKVGRKGGSFALSQMSSMAFSDPFAKIKSMITDMVEKLESEAAQEASQKAFCDEELSKSRKSQEEKSMKMDQVTARVDSAATKSAELQDKIKIVEKEVAAIDRDQAEATKLRGEEHAEYLKASTDYKDSADAVVAAIGVLKSYYDGGALLQVSSRTGAAVHEKAKTAMKMKTRDADTVIGMLEVAESDFTKLMSETETEETSAAESFAKLEKEAQITKASKEAEVKGMASEVKSLQVALTHHTDDQKAVSAELSAVMTYLDKLKPQCEEKAMSFEEKQARRQAEIEGLQDAMAIIDGKSVATPSLLQIS